MMRSPSRSPVNGFGTSLITTGMPQRASISGSTRSNTARRRSRSGATSLLRGDGLLDARLRHLVQRAHHAVRGQLGEQVRDLRVLVVVQRALDALHRGDQVLLLRREL